MYAKATIFDLLLPRIVADVPITRREITDLFVRMISASEARSTISCSESQRT